MRDPERTLPRAIISGTLAIVAIYLTTNAAYLYVLPIDQVAKSPLIAADTMAALIGRSGASFVSIVVAISTFGAVNSDLLGAPRIFYAAAEDGLFFKTLGRVHPTYRTPYISILFSALLGVGGGIVIIPVLVVLFSVPTAIAKGTSLLVIIPTAIAGTFVNRRRGNVDLRAAAIAGLVGAGAAFGGSKLATSIGSKLSTDLFALLLLAVTVQMLLFRRKTEAVT